jgi:anti-sigma B factor antagonist
MSIQENILTFAVVYGYGPTGRSATRKVDNVLGLSQEDFLNLYIQNEQLVGRTGVTIMGEIDMSNSSVLGDHLTGVVEAEKKDLVLNLAQVAFIDSTGLAVLISARRHLGLFGRSLVLEAPSDAVSRILEVTGLNVLFQTEDAFGLSDLAVKEPA